jgi:choline dehydrogenase-like flavoprotein
MRTNIAIIGSGPSGSIVAYHLANAGQEVVLIEEGVDQETPPFSLKELSVKYRSKGQTIAFGRPNVQYVEGCCVGGGSEINSGLYYRLPESIREAWQQRFHIDSFSDYDLEPHYEACERILQVQLSQSSPSASLKIKMGASKLRWECIEVPRWYGQDGIRRTMTKTFLPLFLKSNGNLLSNTKVLRLIQKGNEWEILTTRGNIIAKTVFVCAGAVQTPLILRKSGIKKNIGNTLALHPTIKLTARFSEEVNGDDAEIPMHQVKEFAPEISLGGSVSRLPHLMAAHAHHPQFPDWFLKTWKNLFTYYAMISTDTRGFIRAIPGCWSPFVSYKMTLQDRKQLALGQKKLAELLFAAGAIEVIDSNGVHFSKVDQLPDRIQENAKGIMTIHLCGSCPMGENSSVCATNSFGRVLGQDNLYISDGSLLGGSPSVNPQGIIMAIARRNALHFLEQRGI